jgi:hypothetical protein
MSSQFSMRSMSSPRNAGSIASNGFKLSPASELVAAGQEPYRCSASDAHLAFEKLPQTMPRFELLAGLPVNTRRVVVLAVIFRADENSWRLCLFHAFTYLPPISLGHGCA